MGAENTHMIQDEENQESLSETQEASAQSRFLHSYNVPELFERTAELATCHRSTQWVVADTDLLVNNAVGKVILAPRHGTDEDSYRMRLGQCGQELGQPDGRRIAGKSELDGVHRQVISDRILDDLEQLLRAVLTANGKLVQELHHEAAESLECAWYPNVRVHLNEYTFRCVDVDLEQASLVEWRVEEGQQALVCNVGPGISNVPARLRQDALVIVAVEQSVLDVALPAILVASAAAHTVRLQACLLENDEEPPLAGSDASLRYVRLHWQHVGIGRSGHGVLGGHGCSSFACSVLGQRLGWPVDVGLVGRENSHRRRGRRGTR